MAQNHVHTIINVLGEAYFLNTLGLTERNLRHAKSSGKFAAHYFDAVDEACRNKGLECPRDAFTWKVAAKDIGNGGKNQGKTKITTGARAQ